MNRFEKLRISMRYRLIGAASVDRRFDVAVRALDFAEVKYDGKFRKDGVTPALMHPLEIMGYHASILPSLRHPAETLAADALHDCVEDYGVSREEIEDKFGKLTGDAVFYVSKEVNGVKVASMEEHFERMLESAIATVVKPADRGNNQNTMVGVFSPAKQVEYIDECLRYIIPMMKRARRIYGDQEAAYENMKLMLRGQISMVRAMHAPALDTPSPSNHLAALTVA